MSDQKETPQGETATTETPQGDPAETLGDGGKKALAAEREARKAAEKSSADYAAKLKQIEDSSLTELERFQREAEESKAAFESLTRENLRSKVALEKGVPADLAQFLTGDNEDDVNAQADALLTRLNAGPATPKPDLSQGAQGAPKTSSPGEQFAAAFEGRF